MKFEEFEQALTNNGDTLDSIGLVELPAEIYKKWNRSGLIRKKLLRGCPVFRGTDGVLYQRLDREVIHV